MNWLKKVEPEENMLLPMLQCGWLLQSNNIYFTNISVLKTMDTVFINIIELFCVAIPIKFKNVIFEILKREIV